MIYQSSEPDTDSVELDREEHTFKNDFVIKFCVKQIEKCCQTDDFMAIDGAFVEERDLKLSGKRISSGIFSLENFIGDEGCNPRDLNKPVDIDLYDNEVREFDTQSWCNKCSNNNNIWRSNWCKSVEPIGLTFNKSNDNLQQIWSNKNICESFNHDSIVLNNNNDANYHKLKYELSKDGEEIMNDLSYMQSLYIGSDWADEESCMEEDAPQDLTPTEISYDVNKFISEFLKPSEIFHLLKPEEIRPKVDKFKPNIVRKLFFNSSTDVQGNEVDGFEESKISAIKVPAGNENETCKSDRKRRHSSTQHPCNELMSGECKKPHCKFSHEISSIPCHFWADNSCQQGGLCQFQHSVAYPRPLTR